LLFIFVTDEGEYDAETLFATRPIWVGNTDAKVWHLKLDTGLVNVVAVEGDECVEKPVQLDVDFAMEEADGSARIGDVEREGKWMTVEE
jgi:hypothetical protein